MLDNKVMNACRNCWRAVHVGRERLLDIVSRGVPMPMSNVNYKLEHQDGGFVMFVHLWATKAEVDVFVMGLNDWSDYVVYLAMIHAVCDWLKLYENHSDYVYYILTKEPVARFLNTPLPELVLDPQFVEAFGMVVRDPLMVKSDELSRVLLCDSECSLPAPNV